MSQKGDWMAAHSHSLGASSPHLNARSSGPSEAGGQSNSNSHVFTSWLRKKSWSSSRSSHTTDQAVRGQLFPAKLALALGMAKCLLGFLLVAFGALALWEQAAMSYLGSGKLNHFLPTPLLNP